MLGWSLVPLSWSKRCHWHLGNITNTHWIKQLIFALESFVPSFPDTRNTRLHYNLWIPLCWQFCHWYDRKHWKIYTHMYRILNRVCERPQTDSDKQHMWLVNKRFTGFSFLLVFHSAHVQNRPCHRFCGHFLVLLDNATLGVYSLTHAYRKYANLFWILRDNGTKQLLCLLSGVVLWHSGLWVNYID